MKRIITKGQKLEKALAFIKIKHSGQFFDFHFDRYEEYLNIYLKIDKRFLFFKWVKLKQIGTADIFGDKLIVVYNRTYLDEMNDYGLLLEKYLKIKLKIAYNDSDWRMTYGRM